MEIIPPSEGDSNLNQESDFGLNEISIVEQYDQSKQQNFWGKSI